MKRINKALKILAAVVLSLGFFFFAVFGGGLSWIAFIFALLLIPLGVFDDAIADYSKLFKK
jgi:hypothetical protein